MDNEQTRIPIDRRNFMRGLAAGQLVACLPAACSKDSKGQVKRIYLAADDHTDYMWTADEEAYRQAFLDTIDHYLNLADQTDDRPEDFQSRWNCDGLLWFREYEQHRSGEQVARLVSRIKSGHISVPMTMLVSCYGGTPTEAVLRGLYYGGHVERKHDLRLRIAVAMENQTLPHGLGMLWAGSGVRYSWKGICGCASKLKDMSDPREHDVYWWVGPDGSRILMKWYSIEQSRGRAIFWNKGPGGYAKARSPELAVEFVDNDPAFRKRNPHSVIGLFGQGWDDLTTIVPLDDPERSFPAVAERLSREERRVIVSNENDYFADMQATHGDDLPQLSCAFGNEWELYTASMAEVSSTVKRATEKLRSAEAMAAVVCEQTGEFAADLKQMRDQAWVAFGLYWEHDWTADGPISRERRAAWQRKIAAQITGYVDALFDRAKEALAEQIRAPDRQRQVAQQRRVFVFNALAWTRTDYVDFPIEDDSVAVFDVNSNRSAPSQVIVVDRKRYVRFLASDVPPCGYRVYELRSGADAKATSTIRWNDSELVSSTHRLRVAENGSIDLWESFALGKKLIENGQANHLQASRGKITIESTGAVCTTLRVDVERPIARTIRITLFESVDRIEIDNTIRENFADVESWRYEFNLESPRTEHEEVGAILRTATKSNDGDYAERQTRTDWLTMNHFVTMGDDTASVVLSNQDCLFFHLGEKIDAPMDSSSNVIQVLAGGQVDGPKLGIPKQGGDRYFRQRFALGCGDTELSADRAVSMRFALEHQNPLVAGRVNPGGGTLDADEFSLIQCESDSVLVWAVKPAEDGAGEGTVVRLWNLSGQPTSYQLSMHRPISQCIKTTHVETEIEPMALAGDHVKETLPAGAMRTMKIKSSRPSLNQD